MVIYQGAPWWSWEGFLLFTTKYTSYEGNSFLPSQEN